MGRECPLTDGQINDIDSRIRRTMRELARTEDGWQALTPDQRMGMAAERAMEDIAAEAAQGGKCQFASHQDQGR